MEEYSGLTDAQQQQQQQQYHQLYQPQDHQTAAPPYDPAQAQAYEAYYASYHYDPSAYHHPHYDPSAYHHHYYPHDYSSYQPPPPAAQPDPVPAPSAAAPHDPSLIHPPQPHHHPAAAAAMAGGLGYPPPPEQQGSGSSSTSAAASYPVPPGLNPAAAAAVAALSQLTQFAGTMDAAARAMAGMQERPWHGKNGGMMGSGGAPPPSHHPHQPHHPPYHPHQYPAQHGTVSIRPGGGGRSPRRGGGRRGSGHFRGGGGGRGRGNSGHHPPKQDVGAAAPFRGRGRGRGRMGRAGSKRFHQSAPDSQQQPNAAPGPDMEQGSGQAPSQASAVAPMPAHMLPRCPLLPIAWCDICRVDCNSLEILEQHKNGKRHKKTVQRVQEIQAQQKLMAELEASVVVKPEITLQKAEEDKDAQVAEVDKASDQLGEVTKACTAPENEPSTVLSDPAGEASKVSAISESRITGNCSVQVNEASKGSDSSENLPAATVAMEMQSQNVDRQSESAKEGEAGTMTVLSDAPHAEAPETEGHARRPRMDGHERYDRRRVPKRKMMRFGQGGKRLRSFEPVRHKPPERPREQPRVCTLCNVMCDTLAVFECHLSGKKHLSRIKRFQGQGTVYGPISVYIPPNQPTAYPPHALEPLFYGLKSHEMLEQEAYGLQQGNQAKQATEAEGAGVVSQVEQSLEHPDNEIPADGTEETVTLDAEGQPVVSGFEEKVPSQPPTVSEAAIMEEVAAFPTTEDAVPLSDGAAHNVVLSGLDVRVEEPNAKN